SRALEFTALPSTQALEFTVLLALFSLLFAFLLSLRDKGLITAAHDLSDGGLAVAATEMAFAAGVGASLELRESLSSAAWFFGEEQARFLVAAPENDVAAILEAARIAGVPALRVGEMGGNALRLGASSVPLEMLREAWSTGFGRLMGET
ncbi:MAG: AIR synthase-related protein, partial [Pseudomonadota bacterium]